MIIIKLGIGDWGWGIGDWGLGIGPNPLFFFFLFEDFFQEASIKIVF